jgi:uncharacterized RDD family membrane protein YckC
MRASLRESGAPEPRRGLAHRSGEAATVKPVTNQQAPASNQQTADSEYYPGRQFGLPEFGRGSVAGWSRRFGALLIDWIVCSVIAVAFFYHPHAGHTASVLTQSRLWTLAVFGAEDWLLTAFTGFTIGKRLVGLRVARLDGQPVGLPRAFARTLLLMLVLPAMMMDRDLRGFQDKAANTVVIRA